MFKTLSRNIAYIKKDSEEKDKAHKPDWNCFCCHDSGFIANHLIRLVIPEYDMKNDRIPVCNRFDCNSRPGQNLLESDSLDDRVDSQTCEQLHQFNLNQWKDWEVEATARIQAAQEKVDEFVEEMG